MCNPFQGYKHFKTRQLGEARLLAKELNEPKTLHRRAEISPIFVSEVLLVSFIQITWLAQTSPS